MAPFLWKVDDHGAIDVSVWSRWTVGGNVTQPCS
jgi:hypothetical protein